jgi:hypothetical protein
MPQRLTSAHRQLAREQAELDREWEQSVDWLGGLPAGVLNRLATDLGTDEPPACPRTVRRLARLALCDLLLRWRRRRLGELDSRET